MIPRHAAHRLQALARGFPVLAVTGPRQSGKTTLVALTLDELLYRGLYPPLYVREVATADWYAAYVQSYLDRDVRQVLNVGSLADFKRFLRLAAARVGQLLNLARWRWRPGSRRARRARGFRCSTKTW